MTRTKFAKAASIALLLTSGVTLVALQAKPQGWLLWALSISSLMFTEKRFARDLLLINGAVAVLGLTEISTDIEYGHMVTMALLLGLVVIIPYLISRFVYKDRQIRFPFHHGRRWYKTEVAYVLFAAVASYLILPFYLSSTGAYLNWPSGSDTSSLLRLFIGTNALGIWDEIFFVGVVFGLLRRHLSFLWANFAQAVLWTAFLYELGFTGWGPVAVFVFALLQGYVFNKTHSLLYVITIHLTLDFFLFLALVNAHNSRLFDIFIG